MALFKRKTGSSAASGADARGLASSDAGGIVMWSRAALAHVTADDWDDELCEDDDIARHVAAGALVPIFVGIDGAFAVETRWSGDAALSPRERQYLTANGRGAYRLVTGSDGAWVSGLEHVGADPWSGFAVPLDAGTWSVELALIGWDEEPGARGADGKPSSDALADFVVIVKPALAAQIFATEVEAFERPSSGSP